MSTDQQIHTEAASHSFDLQDDDMPEQPATPSGPRRRRRRRGGSRPGSSEPPTS